ncbi:MAG: response regulator [Bdellovibrionales bacterium]|jgi:CheY-like chemotaxis protein|nr:response regulator [Bdellovibrionales bacterium]MBT3526320.1 response regulator [Bdellovibrionales bacterium]MBT7670664.1 response regulator [Bdellovibrionales bacterium]MBT7766220.1 response regulator [Bdellovibrionales bacterium]
MSKTKSLVFIEDNRDHAEIISFYIKDCYPNYEITLITDGEEAMIYFDEVISNKDKSLPDLVFLDIKLPKFSGLDILNKIKSDEILRLLPVIIFTTSIYHKDIEDALAAHANSYIVKPDMPDAFGPLVDKVISYWTSSQHSMLIDRINAERTN